MEQTTVLSVENGPFHVAPAGEARKKRWRCACVLSCTFFGVIAAAAYFALLPDDNLAEQVPDGANKLFTRGEAFAIDEAMNDILLEKELWYSTKIYGGTAVSNAVIDINATTEAVWRVLLDFPSYPKNKMPMVSKTVVYKTEKGRNVEQYGVKSVVKVLWISLTFHWHEIYEPAKRSLSWTTDHDKKNDVDEVQGHWHVIPHPKDSSQSRVFYAISVRWPRWIPAIVVNYGVKHSTIDTAAWVKKVSEDLP